MRHPKRAATLMLLQRSRLLAWREGGGLVQVSERAKLKLPMLEARRVAMAKLRVAVKMQTLKSSAPRPSACLHCFEWSRADALPAAARPTKKKRTVVMVKMTALMWAGGCEPYCCESASACWVSAGGASCVCCY